VFNLSNVFNAKKNRSSPRISSCLRFFRPQLIVGDIVFQREFEKAGAHHGMSRFLSRTTLASSLQTLVP